jgi:3',5'-cyclic AMP phosphodiesterase CpdA
MHRRQALTLLSMLSAVPIGCVWSSDTALGANSQHWAVTADSGTGDQGQYAVASAMAQVHRQTKFDFALLGGDNIYDNGEIEKIGAVFEKPYQPLLSTGVKFYAVLGNHDIRTDQGKNEIKYFQMPGNFYSFTKGAVSFFALDTNEVDDAQLRWLDKALANAKTPWKVVYGHHPIYSSGHYGTNQKLVQILVPLMQKHRVQLYLNGHEHDYERTKTLDGIVYITCGGGAHTRPVGKSAFTAYSASVPHFLSVMNTDKILHVQAIDTQGKIMDEVTLNI